MRQSEIIKLRVDDVIGRVATLRRTKNGDMRRVPLSLRAIDLLGQLDSVNESLFNVRAMSVSQCFTKAVAQAGIDDLRFHDSRHEAITRMSRKLDVLALARAIGHRDLKSLMTYYNERAEDLALKLD